MEHVGRMEHSGNINLGISWIQLTIMGRFTGNNVTDSTNQHAIIVSSILTRKAGDIHQSQQEQATQYLVNPSVYGYIYIMVMYWIILAFSDRLQIPGSPEPPSASETHCFDESQPAPPNRNLPSAGWANAQAAKRFGAGRIPVQWLVLDKHETTHMKKHSWITTLKRHVNMFDSYVWLNLQFVWFLPRVRFAKKTTFFFSEAHVMLAFHGMMLPTPRPIAFMASSELKQCLQASKVKLWCGKCSHKKPWQSKPLPKD